MAALILSLTFSETDLARAILDKNNPVRGLFFDLTGLMIATGVLAAVFRPENDRGKFADLPAPGRAMTALLGMVVLAGFMLEGLRIAMTGWPDGSQYAFVGYITGFLLRDMDAIANIYGFAWYAHAILIGALIALIPFTRMVHIIVAPVLLVAEARSRTQGWMYKIKPDDMGELNNLIHAPADIEKWVLEDLPSRLSRNPFER